MEKLKLINEIFKTIMTVGITVVAFVFVTHPGSVLNREVTLEEIRREQVKIMLQINNITDLEQRSNAWQIFLDHYPEKDADIKATSAYLSLTTRTQRVSSGATGAPSSSECERLDTLLEQLANSRNQATSALSEASDELRASLSLHL